MPLVIYDTETTGVRSDARIVELAAVILTDDGDSCAFHSRCDPGIIIPAEASAVHGITNADVEGFPSDSQVVDELHEVLEKIMQTATNPLVLAGHNTSFDARILGYYRPLPDHLKLCTLREARRLYPTADNHQLGTLHEMLIHTEGLKAHSAMDDVYMTLDLINHFTEVTGMGYVDMAQNQIRPKSIRTMPFGKHKGKKFADIPKSYLKYMLENIPDLDADVKLAMQQQLQ